MNKTFGSRRKRKSYQIVKKFYDWKWEESLLFFKKICRELNGKRNESFFLVWNSWFDIRGYQPRNSIWTKWDTSQLIICFTAFPMLSSLSSFLTSKSSNNTFLMLLFHIFSSSSSLKHLKRTATLQIFNTSA